MDHQRTELHSFELPWTQLLYSFRSPLHHRGGQQISKPQPAGYRVLRPEAKCFILGLPRTSLVGALPPAGPDPISRHHPPLLRLPRPLKQGVPSGCPGGPCRCLNGIALSRSPQGRFRRARTRRRQQPVQHLGYASPKRGANLKSNLYNNNLEGCYIVLIRTSSHPVNILMLSNIA